MAALLFLSIKSEMLSTQFTTLFYAKGFLLMSLGAHPLLIFLLVSDTHLQGSRPFPRRRQWHPTPVLLPGKSHGWRSLVGCSPWGREESDMTERLHFHFYALEKEMATHSSVLAWRIPGMGSHRVGNDWSDLAEADPFLDPLLFFHIQI